jgi:hypothetical protein
LFGSKDGFCTPPPEEEGEEEDEDEGELPPLPPALPPLLPLPLPELPPIIKAPGLINMLGLIICEDPPEDELPLELPPAELPDDEPLELGEDGDDCRF